VGGASSTAEERKAGSASSSADAQSHSAAGRIPLRELWEYVKAKEAEARRRDVCEGILQSLFGEPSGRTETDITYQFDECSVVLWSSIGTKDMASGGCIVVDYTSK